MNENGESLESTSSEEDNSGEDGVSPSQKMFEEKKSKIISEKKRRPPTGKKAGKKNNCGGAKKGGTSKKSSPKKGPIKALKGTFTSSVKRKCSSNIQPKAFPHKTLFSSLTAAARDAAQSMPSSLPLGDVRPILNRSRQSAHVYIENFYYGNMD